jgi:hypothetical protein
VRREREKRTREKKDGMDCPEALTERMRKKEKEARQ